MRILIEFDSCWQTSFLGDDPKKPISKVSSKINKPTSDGYMQKFVATSGTRGETPAPISLSTILGVLSRLIGDQRKLYQSRKSDNYYFSDLEEKITWNLSEPKAVNELMYLTNKSDDRCGQSSYLGVLEDDNPWFFAKDSYLLWSVLFLNKNQLIEFILSKKTNYLSPKICFPKNLIERVSKISDSKVEEGEVFKVREKLINEKQVVIEKIKKSLASYHEKIKSNPPKTPTQNLKSKTQLVKLEDKLADAELNLESFLKNDESLSFDAKLKKVIEFLSCRYPDDKNIGEEYCKNGVVYPMSLYSAALYLQAEYLLVAGYDLPFIKNSKSEIQIQGFSKRGFNGVRDWLNGMTGKRKKEVGTPVQVNKHSGKLEIELSLDPKTDKGAIKNNISRAQELAELIENAGVSSFYLGKKGLAYVTKIRT
ncbi:MAG: type I-Fv CRISPR-associated protein Cas5fv [Paraglaciecola sp.]|uniref:type I-Fv CRISPR-associated protein Cas5fv n=1 Tax=Paraglaciecola sp. TaxID=1920173 RepID=UPI003297654C